MLKEYRLMYNKYDGSGWLVYKVENELIAIVKSLGVLQACHPDWKVMIEERTISEWKGIKIDV